MTHHKVNRIPESRYNAQMARYKRKYTNVPREDFAGGPSSGTYRFSYPCNTPRRCIAALAYARHSNNPNAIRKRVYQIAARKGFLDPRTGRFRIK